jgi:hypothetical protein
MKVLIMIEDTPKGVATEFRWMGNDVTDHQESSLSLNLAAQVAQLIRDRCSVGSLVLDDMPSIH